MSKFNRKNRVTESVPAITISEMETAVVEVPAQMTASQVRFNSAVDSILSLSDAEVRELSEVCRTVLSDRRQARKPTVIAVDTQVTWTVLRKRGEVVYTGVVVGCKGRNSFIKTPTGIEVVKTAQLTVVTEQ